MPQLLITPEDWFRTQHKDLYLLSFKKKSWVNPNKEIDRVQRRLHRWFANHLPHVALGMAGPSEYSGWIVGGGTYITADIDSHEAEMVHAMLMQNHYLKMDVMRYSDWLACIDSARLLPVPLKEPAVKIRWWDTPKGILLLHCPRGEWMLSWRDAWWKLQSDFDEFRGMEVESYPNGYLLIDEKGGLKNKYTIVVESLVDWGGKYSWDSSSYSQNIEKITVLRDALGILRSEEVDVWDGDF